MREGENKILDCWTFSVIYRVENQMVNNFLFQYAAFLANSNAHMGITWVGLADRLQWGLETFEISQEPTRMRAKR